MPSTYSTNLKIELQATGENSGTWGTITNTNLGTALEQAIVGYGNPDFATDANLTLTYTDTNAAQAARALVLNVTSTGSLTATRELVVPTIQKQYIVQNNTTGSQSITVKTSAGTGITVPNGRKAHLYVDGTNVIYMDDYVDINGGAIDGTPIGASSASTGAFTTATATTGNITTVNATTVDATNVEVTNVKAKDGTAALTIADSTGKVTVSSELAVDNLNLSGNAITSTDSNGNIDLTPNGTGEVNITKVDIDSGAIDGTTIGANSAAAATFTTATATTGNITTVNATTVDTTNVEVTNIKAKDGTAATIADSTGKITVSTELAVDNLNLSGNAITSTDTNGNIDLTPNGTGEVNITKVDIDSGAIDGTTIGGSSAAAGTFTSLTNSGNLTFSSTGQRITGDFSNATHSSRLLFQSSGANLPTVVGALPNGSSVTSAFVAYGGSTATDTATVSVVLNGGTDARINSGILGTGTYLPITFYTGGSERMRLDTSGNLGIGTASPNAKTTLVQGTQTYGFTIQANSSSQAGNIRFTDAGFTAEQALISSVNGGGLTFSTGSGSAERMRIDSSGNVGIGTTNATFKLVAANSGTDGGWMYSTGSVSVLGLGGYANAGDGAFQIRYDRSTGGITFNGGTRDTPAARMTIDSSGNVGIGGTAGAGTKLDILGTLPSSGSQTNGVHLRGTIPSSTTAAWVGFWQQTSTQAASFTLTEAYHFAASGMTIGAGSAVTNQYGFWVGSTFTGATNNYGFYSNIASGSNRWNFYAAGTADNYFAGRVFFTSTNATPATNNVEGMAWTTSKNLQVSCEGDPLFVNRKGSDGALVNFYQDGAAEGNISVAGNTVSYNPFMGSHYTEIVGAMPTLKGTVLESLDELVDGKYSNQDRLPKAKVSDTVGSSAVYGVYFAPDSDPDTNDGILAAALGASWVRIAAGVTVQRGDLLESNGDGCAKVQSDDIIRSKTIGKVTSTTVANTYPDGSYIVPCVLYCG